MATQQAPERKEWISPIGQSIADSIAEQERLDPEYKRERERNRPCREVARQMLIRRTELGITQKELARRMGISPRVVSRLERGQRDLSAAMIARLRQAIAGV